MCHAREERHRKWQVCRGTVFVPCYIALSPGRGFIIEQRVTRGGGDGTDPVWSREELTHRSRCGAGLCAERVDLRGHAPFVFRQRRHTQRDVHVELLLPRLCVVVT